MLMMSCSSFSNSNTKGVTRWFAPSVTVRFFRTRRPAHQLYDLWAWSPESETGLPGR
jgi:hypothetical protein